ncbi:MAG: 4-hydroxy-tetrahydrodipicolinate reductase [Lachnospiraceae bacterium]|nr:4-hydroxy-tetrahydrodipicolinate reductase [Lachnospiraceae bacterium]
MVRMIMHGCNGRMGQMITKIAEEEKNIQIVAGVDKFGGMKNDYPVFEDIKDCDVEADVVIDFTNSEAVDGLLTYCKDKKLPIVLCTTGMSDKQLKDIEDASKQIPILRSGNMSLGINTLIKVLNEISPALAKAGFDIEIVEKHHRHKLDSPSGTAILLADSINESLPEKYDYVYDRTDRRQERPVNEIGISAVRGGSIVGDHDVIFAGLDEVITLSHRAYSRSVFAKGAITAALFLSDKKSGMYSMADCL